MFASSPWKPLMVELLAMVGVLFEKIAWESEPYTCDSRTSLSIVRLAAGDAGAGRAVTMAMPSSPRWECSRFISVRQRGGGVADRLGIAVDRVAALDRGVDAHRVPALGVLVDQEGDGHRALGRIDRERR